ncbi:MAG: hypothetical protein EON59_01235 [Alphaproteobacteria bacterium]|nr:MAG: hypothetical protein EON59_01235 [Alphaproteobacteria bacterium]
METWAVEIEGEPGVRLYDVREGTVKLLWGELDSLGLETLDVRRVGQWAISTPQPPWSLVSEDAIAGVNDYRFDPTARCWRPPEQPFAAPEGHPLQGTSLRMSVEPPDAGWLPVRLGAGDVVVEFSISNAFDPFYPSFEPKASRNWIAWLKAVAEDGHPRLTLDLEGHFLEFHILEPEGSTVRFLVASSSLVAWRPELDMRIERRALVEALYRPLHALWESDGFAAAWRQWCFIDSEPDYEKPWRFRSSLLEAWLG